MASTDKTTVPVKKEVKESDVFNDIVKYMNSQRDVTLLLYAWNLLGIRNASYAEMKLINKDGFELDVKIGKRSQSVYHAFKTPLKDATESRKVLMALHEKASFVSWPTGIMPIIVLLGYIAAFLAIIPYQDLMNIKILESMKEYSLKYIFGSSTTASVVLVTTLLAHSIEAIYTYYLCTQHIKLSRANSLTWVSLCLILGYPVTADVIYLSKVATKKLGK